MSVVNYSTKGKIHNLDVGLSKVPLGVKTVTVQAIPSTSGWICEYGLKSTVMEVAFVIASTPSVQPAVVSPCSPANSSVAIDADNLYHLLQKCSTLINDWISELN